MARDIDSLSAIQLEQYLKIADKVLDRIVAPKGSRQSKPEAAVRKPRGDAQGNRRGKSHGLLRRKPTGGLRPGQSWMS